MNPPETSLQRLSSSTAATTTIVAIEPTVPAPAFHLIDGCLRHGEVAVLEGRANSDWSLHHDATGAGTFLAFRPPERPAGSRVEVALGRLAGLRRFTGAFRCNPFWVRPAVGQTESEVRPATFWLLAETSAADFVLLVPLLGDRAAFSLRGEANGLVLVGETGDAAVPVPPEVALFVARGSDPFTLLRDAARAVHCGQSPVTAPAPRPPPDFVDLFGWCTWDAFYQEVSPEKIRAGLRSFAAAGVRPRLLVLDDGWQSVATAPTGEQVLTDLRPNRRFDHDLAPLVRAVKAEFGITRFLVWHALTGYWGGVSGASLPAYQIRQVARNFAPELLAHDADGELRKWGTSVGVPSAAAAARLFDDYHRSLRAQGVDGVKVDNQAVLEAVSAGQGGRVQLARTYRAALDASVSRHFAGRIINCMSCTPEGVYLTTSPLMRTSDDFWPHRAESHGQHVYTNAHAGLWFGEFVCPDWDMFQSGHPRGGFHAAARVVSGGPVYVSDAPGQHDANLLRQLVLHDGTVLRADGPGRLTRDLLFTDPTHAPTLLKIFNTVGNCGLLGVFNAHPPAVDAGSAVELVGTVSATDVEGLAGEHFIAYHARDGRLYACARTDRHDVGLPAGGWDLVTYAPLLNGVAVIGLADKLNSAGAILQRRDRGDSTTVITLRDGGEFLAWTQRRIASVTCNHQTVPHRHEADGTLRVHLPAQATCCVSVQWR